MKRIALRRRAPSLLGRACSRSNLTMIFVLLAMDVAGCTGGVSGPGSSESAAPPPVASQGAPSAETSAKPISSRAVASPGATVSTSPASSPSAAALPACLDKATYDLLMTIAHATIQEALVKENAAALIAGLEGFAPAQKFDADFRDKVVTALKAADYRTALQLILSGLLTQQWSLTRC